MQCPSGLSKSYIYHEKLKKGLPGEWNKPLVFTKHHESHAASAFYPSPFEEAAILTMDGVGEWDAATIGVGNGNQMELLKSLEFPHSLGLLYGPLPTFVDSR